MTFAQWYADWQSQGHVEQFDFRIGLSDRNLVRDYESYNDVRLLNEGLNNNRDIGLFEVGCATGEFYRYLALKHPRVNYYGVDVSKPAIERAQRKYPTGRFFVVDPGADLAIVGKRLCYPRVPDVIYSKYQTGTFLLDGDKMSALREECEILNRYDRLLVDACKTEVAVRVGRVGRETPPPADDSIIIVAGELKNGDGDFPILPKNELDDFEAWARRKNMSVTKA